MERWDENRKGRGSWRFKTPLPLKLGRKHLRSTSGEKGMATVNYKGSFVFVGFAGFVLSSVYFSAESDIQVPSSLHPTTVLGLGNRIGMTFAKDNPGYSPFRAIIAPWPANPFRSINSHRDGSSSVLRPLPIVFFFFFVFVGRVDLAHVETFHRNYPDLPGSCY